MGRFQQKVQESCLGVICTRRIDGVLAEMEYIKEVCQTCQTDPTRFRIWLCLKTGYPEIQRSSVADSCRKQALMKNPLPEGKLLRRLTRTASSKKKQDSSLNSAEICMLIDDIWIYLVILDDHGCNFANFLPWFSKCMLGQDEWHRRLKEARLGFALIRRPWSGDAMVRSRTSWMSCKRSTTVRRSADALLSLVLPFISSWYKWLLG